MRLLFVILGIWGISALSPSLARAGVFNIPSFVDQGDFALGIEPEVTFTNGAGIGGNLKYTHGIAGFSNLTGIVGTGTGPRKFRVGGNLTFDFIPDVDKQPGLGFATQLLYQKLSSGGQLEITVIPYLHKSFVPSDSQSGNAVDPFVAIPFGWAFNNGNYKPISTLVVGAAFHTSESLRVISEFGIAINNAETYLSGGIAYYH